MYLSGCILISIVGAPVIDIINKQIGLNIKKQRQKIRFSLEKTAASLGISVEQLREFENGEREFYPDDLLDFARALYTVTDNLVSTLATQPATDAGYVGLATDGEDDGDDLALAKMSPEEIAAEIASMSPMLKVSLIKVLFELKKSE